MDTTSRITAIEQDPRRPGTVRLELDGTRFGVVPAELIVAEGLSPGQTIAPDVHERLSAAADAEAAFRTGLRSAGAAPIRPGRSRPATATQRSPSCCGRRRARAAPHVGAAQRRGVRPKLRADPRSAGPRARHVSSAICWPWASSGRSSIGAVAAEWPEGSDRTSMPQALVSKRAAQLGTLPKTDEAPPAPGLSGAQRIFGAGRQRAWWRACCRGKLLAPGSWLSVYSPKCNPVKSAGSSSISS